MWSLFFRGYISYKKRDTNQILVTLSFRAYCAKLFSIRLHQNNSTKFYLGFMQVNFGYVGRNDLFDTNFWRWCASDLNWGITEVWEGEKWMNEYIHQTIKIKFFWSKISNFFYTQFWCFECPQWISSHTYIRIWEISIIFEMFSSFICVLSHNQNLVRGLDITSVSSSNGAIETNENSSADTQNKWWWCRFPPAFNS